MVTPSQRAELIRAALKDGRTQGRPAGGGGTFVQQGGGPCVVADIFAECFTGCVGDLFAGPVCGWTFDTFTTPTPGWITLDGDQMIMTAGVDFPYTDYVGAKKSLSGPFPAVNTTHQYRFTQHTAIPFPPFSAYGVNFTDGAGVIRAFSYFYGNGAVYVGNDVSIWTGTWFPVPGATVTAHVTFDGSGVPSLWLDGVSIPLTLLAPFVAYASPSVANLFFDKSGTHNSAEYDYLFAATGVLPPTTVFCCPEGGPAT